VLQRVLRGQSLTYPSAFGCLLDLGILQRAFAGLCLPTASVACLDKPRLPARTGPPCVTRVDNEYYACFMHAVEGFCSR